jgi:hypothetical protein
MTNRRLIAVAALCILALPSVANAQDSGFEGGLRTGYGVPLGKLTGAEDLAGDEDELSEGIAGIIPFWIDAGFRIDPNLFVGGYFQYAPGFIGSTLDRPCDIDSVDCTTSSMRVGAQIHFHVAPTSPANPWIGYGLGYEWYRFKAEGPGGEIGFTASGFEFANFQAGLDFMPSPNFYIGPFVSFSLGQYDSLDVDCSGGGCVALPAGGSIDEKALHEWFVFGLRGGYTGFGG